MTLPGVPAVYYGDELGVTSEWTRTGADADLRPTLTLTDLGQSPDLLAVVRRLGRFRKANAWLASAALTEFEAHDGALSYTAAGAGHTLRVHLNPTDSPVVADGVEIPPHGWDIRIG